MRLVFDTNTVISALVFGKGRLAWLRQAWREGQCIPLACKETIEELLRVLAYPKFRLTESEVEALLEEYLPYVEVVPAWSESAKGAKTARLPVCRDSADQVFLELAAVSGADGLITGDGDLLVLAGQTDFPILGPEELAGRMRER